MTPELMEAGTRQREAWARRHATGPGESGGREASWGRVVRRGDVDTAQAFLSRVPTPTQLPELRIETVELSALF